MSDKLLVTFMMVMVAGVFLFGGIGGYAIGTTGHLIHVSRFALTTYRITTPSSTTAR